MIQSGTTPTQKTELHENGGVRSHEDRGYIDVLPQPPGSYPDDFLFVGVHHSGRAVFRRNGIEVPLKPGDVLVTGTPHPASLWRDGSSRITYFRIPSFYLGTPPAEVRRVGGLMARGSDGIGSLISQFLTMLADPGEAPHLVTGNHLARSVADLVALMVTDLLQRENPTPVSATAETLTRIRSYIEENLMDPKLSPKSIARANYISVRYLHKLFQHGDVTVGQWVRLRRLEACRRELGQSRHGQDSVAAIAHRWGFVNPSHFSRVFRATYGFSPSEWQAHVLDGSATPAPGRPGRTQPTGHGLTTDGDDHAADGALPDQV
ncbi:helix-turn-helix domain-containing protein [Kitasatospora sp. NPDC048540]|uniref:helix-turn-helix domain-containing protein n=1 Tax=unclassified Kitasatospora TaxID=2633591 RepID=UPI00068A82D1|nr:helix-turn-helix domain-containing protein [Kitasatospora sp. MBT63]